MHDDPTFATLAGQLLVAMPSIQDPRFHRAVIFICAHDRNGAMGLMLNQPVPGMMLDNLLEQLEIPHDDSDADKTTVMNGGPVETGRGFVLHGPDFYQKETVVVNDQFSVTATVDALQAIAQNQGPHEIAFMLGYAGWQAGQLEQEIANNAWLTVEATPDLVFDTHVSDKWDMSMSTIGIKPEHLTNLLGHA